MGGEIFVEVAAIMDYAERLRAAAENLENVAEALDAARVDLKSAWIDVAFDSFNASFEEGINDVYFMISFACSMAESLEQVAAEYQTADEKVLSMI